MFITASFSFSGDSAEPSPFVLDLNPRITLWFSREINLPVFAPGSAAVHRAMTLPMGSPIGNSGPGEPGENLVTSLIPPLAVKIDGIAFKSSAPDQEPTRRRGIRPGVFPLAGLRIKGAKAETFDHRSSVRSLEELQRNQAVQDLARRERSRPLSGSISQRKPADGSPLAFEKIELLGLCTRG